MAKERKIKLGIAWESGDWTTDTVLIPANTLEEDIEKVALAVWGVNMELFCQTHEWPEEMAYIHVWYVKELK